MATKRLSGWVEVFEDGSLGMVCPTRKEALIGMAGARRVVERLPGDVVLSREDVAELKELVQANLSPTRPHGTDGRILALLRGRR